MGHHESGDTLTIVGAWSRTGDHFPIGSQWSLAGENVSTLVLLTGRPSRIDDFTEASGPLAAASREMRVAQWPGCRSLSTVAFGA
jgi:hypothetical protein